MDLVRGSRMVSELGKRMLIIVAKRGYTGASREVFFHHIRGIRYADLEKEVLKLEKEGVISIEWVGPSNFTVNITPKGVDMAKSYQEDVWKKSAEALEKVQSTKHAEKSIILDNVGYKKIIDDKMHVSEVGAVGDDIMGEIDKQILDERTHEGEEVRQLAVSVPAWEETVDAGQVGVEKDVVERRMSGEIEIHAAEGGAVIQPETGEEEQGGRIEADDQTIRTTVREKRISGDVGDEDQDEMEGKKKAPPRPPKSFVGSVTETEPEAHEEEPQEEPTPSPEYTRYEEPAETPEYTQDEEPTEAPVEEEAQVQEPAEPELDTLPGFSLEELLADDDDPTPAQEDSTGEVSYAASDALCMWEPENECPFLMASESGWEGNITTSHCMVCQLIQVKRLLENR